MNESQRKHRLPFKLPQVPFVSHSNTRTVISILQCRTEDEIRLGRRRLDEQERAQGKESHRETGSDGAASSTSGCLDAGRADSRLGGLGRNDVDTGQSGWAGLARVSGLRSHDGGIGSLRGWTDRGRGLRSWRDLGGDTNRGRRLNGRGRGLLSWRDLGGDTNRGRRLNGRGGGLNLRGRGGWNNRADRSRGHIARRGRFCRDDGWRRAGLVLSGLDGLDRGSAAGGLRHRSAIEEVSMC
jgi:hypothetical protein